MMLARGLHLNPLGEPLLVIGTQKCCIEILQLVTTTKEAAQQSKAQAIVLENKQK